MGQPSRSGACQEVYERVGVEPEGGQVVDLEDVGQVPVPLGMIEPVAHDEGIGTIEPHVAGRERHDPPRRPRPAGFLAGRRRRPRRARLRWRSSSCRIRPSGARRSRRAFPPTPTSREARRAPSDAAPSGGVGRAGTFRRPPAVRPRAVRRRRAPRAAPPGAAGRGTRGASRRLGRRRRSAASRRSTLRAARRTSTRRRVSCCPACSTPTTRRSRSGPGSCWPSLCVTWPPAPHPGDGPGRAPNALAGGTGAVTVVYRRPARGSEPGGEGLNGARGRPCSAQRAIPPRDGQARAWPGHDEEER